MAAFHARFHTNKQRKIVFFAFKNGLLIGAISIMTTWGTGGKI